MKLNIPKWALSSTGKGWKLRIKSIAIAMVPVIASIFNFTPLTETETGFVIEIGFVVVGIGLHFYGWIRADLNK